MSLVRVQTVWTGVAGAPYYTNLYALGPGTTLNGQDLANAWHAFMTSLLSFLTSGLVATIDGEILEFNEADGVVTGAGTYSAPPVVFTGLGNDLPHSSQGLIQWTTNGLVHNRRVKGRTYIPGVLAAYSNADGIPLSSIDTPVEAAIDTFLSTMSGRMRIWARPFTQKDPDKMESNPSRPGSAHAVTDGNMAPYWAILRSRRD